MNPIYAGFSPLPFDADGWHSEYPIFDRLVEETRPGTIIEVGTWKGGSALHMAVAAKALYLVPTIYCVDTWLGALEFLEDPTPKRDLMKRHGYPAVYYQFLSNVVHMGLQDIITPIPNTSAIAARYLANKGVRAGLIYIDGSHCEEDVFADIKAYAKLRTPNGVMFGDDYAWPGVRNAVDTLAPSLGALEVENGNFWVIRHK